MARMRKGRRCLRACARAQLATLRLQNLIGVQGQNWDALKPTDPRCLTQLGGCTVVGEGGETLFSWVDVRSLDLTGLGWT
jgi:hypothetical protein